MVAYNDLIQYDGTGGRKIERMQTFEKKIGQATTLTGIALTVRGGADIAGQVSVSAEDALISKDGDTFVPLSTTPTVGDDGLVLISLCDAEMDGNRIVIKLSDTSPIKAWEDELVVINTVADTPATTDPGAVAMEDEVHAIYEFLTGGARRYKLTSGPANTPVEGATIRVTTDKAGLYEAATPQITDASGVTTWDLAPGIYYVWRVKTGLAISNPDIWQIKSVSPPSDKRIS